MCLRELTFTAPKASGYHDYAITSFFRLKNIKKANTVSNFRKFFSDDICDFLEETPPIQSKIACSSSDPYKENPTHSLEANLDELLVQYRGKELKEAAENEIPSDTSKKQKALPLLE